MAKNPFNIGIFNGPSYSGFSIAHGNRVSSKAGVIKPVMCDYLDTGERLKDLDIGALVRQAPMLAPTLDTYEITIDAFAVRLRTLGMAGRNPWQYEDFFNYNKNIDGSYTLPSFLLGRFYALNNPLKLGTLYESLNYPSFKWLREEILEQCRELGWVFNPVATLYDAYYNSAGYVFIGPSALPTYYSSEDEISRVDFSNLVSAFRLNSFPGRPYFVNSLSFSGIFTAFPSLVNFVFTRYPRAFRGIDDYSVWEDADEFLNIGNLFQPTEKQSFAPYNVLDEVYKLYRVDAESVLREFTDYLMDSVFHLVYNDETLNINVTGDLEGSDYAKTSLFSYVLAHLFRTMDDCPHVDDGRNLFATLSEADTSYLVSDGWPELDEFFDVSVPDYFFNSYWKIISDWYINTALFEPDSFYLEHYCHVDEDNTYEPFKKTNTLFFRYWKNDYFTSAFPNSQLGSAVGIPVNGTIIDFRNANSWQKFKERLQYAGSRWRDVLYAVTGKRTSSAIMDMSEPLGRWKCIVNVDSVLQTSQSTESSPQAAYAGSGLAYKLDGRSVSYTAEEPTVIMVVMNINPVAAAYFDGFPRKFLRSNLYQYDTAQLANVGEQQIYNYELFFGPDGRMASAGYSPIFGWTRRYGDFMWTPDEVHGDFRGDLDFWHNARTFVNAPRLNEQFLQVRPDDDNLNRIFAVSSPVVDKFYCHVFFSGHIIRHLPKHAYYDL